MIVEALGIAEVERSWAVPRNAQTESRLAGREQVTFLPPVKSRDLLGALRNLRAAVRLQRRLRPGLVVTAGAAQAVPHMLAAAAMGTPITYVESVARTRGPSVTGRIAAVLPRTTLMAQHAGWGRRWRHCDDVFSGFTVADGEPVVLESATVALGSERYPFVRAVEAVRNALGSEVDVTWQVGNTDLADAQPNRWLRPDEMAAAMASSSVVITHGGVGSILMALQAGKLPVVLTRSPALGEHCDDHQAEMCGELAARGLVVLVPPGVELNAEHLGHAAAARVIRHGGAH